MLAVVAVLLAGAALVVSLVRKPDVQTSSQQTPMPTATVPAQQLFNADADRSLCEAIAPLMKENEDRGREFTALQAGSPEQGAAISGYRSFVEDWARRVQDVLNKHIEPERYLTR
ncbi:MAG: hypothetical protein WAM92_11680, partial [Mycobacterium sp.]